MLSALVSTLVFSIILVIVGCFLLLSNLHVVLLKTNNNSLKSFDSTFYDDEIQETTSEEFMLSINISRNSLEKDKNLTWFNTSTGTETTKPTMTTTFDTPSPQQQNTTTPAVVRKHIADKNVVVVAAGALVDENDNNFHYRINKSNQENNFNNQKVTPPLSNGKIVNSSSSASTSSSSETTLTSTTSASSAYFERVELHESLTHDKTQKLLLHRNKRYLLFPDGSSFQLVFDLIIPIVDYTNYAIMGITCAVAWELPSKPPSEIIENFRHKLNDGTFGLSRRNDSIQQQLKYINTAQNEYEGGGGAAEEEEEKEGLKQQQQQQRLSATVATTSAHQHFITNALKPPPPAPLSSSNFYFHNIQQQQKYPTVPPTPPATFFYNQHHQQQQQQQQKWHNNNNLKFSDNNNQRNTFYGSDNKQRPIYQNDFTQHSNYNRNPPNKWNFNKNWQHQQPPKHTKLSHDNAGDYWNKENWWERNKNRIEKQWHQNQQKWSQYQEKQSFSNSQQNYHHPPIMFSTRTGRNRKILNKPPKHRIYPVFGKRRRRRSSGYQNTQKHSVDAEDYNDEFAKKLQEIHIKEHLHSRKKLYGKIEKLYKTRGHNGTACVLRALCETEKLHLNAHYNEAPQSFVMELLRSIFALPKDTLTSSKDSMLHIDGHYSDAVMHAHDETSQSCSQQYDGCEHSISYDMQF